jgi:hypothetical protein
MLHEAGMPGFLGVLWRNEPKGDGNVRVDLSCKASPIPGGHRRYICLFTTAMRNKPTRDLRRVLQVISCSSEVTLGISVLPSN